MICNQLKECIEKEKRKIELNFKCPNNKIDCIKSSDCRSNVKCEERGKKYILENTLKKHIVSYRMDGGVIKTDKLVPSGTCKCDSLLVINSSEYDAILVELKGKDVAHAIEQIEGTLVQFKEVFSGFKHIYARAVVTSSTPDLKATPVCYNLMKKMKQTYKGNLKISEIKMVEKDTKLKEK